MHRHNYLKKHRYPINPVKAKVYRVPDESNNPHKQWKFALYVVPKKQQREGLTLNPWQFIPTDIPFNYITFTGCTCEGCEQYHRLIARMNPERFAKMTGLNDLQEPFIRRVSDAMRERSAQKYWRENRQKSSIRWRG